MRGWDTRSGLFGAIARAYGLSSTLHASSSMLKSGPASYENSMGYGLRLHLDYSSRTLLWLQYHSEVTNLSWLLLGEWT